MLRNVLHRLFKNFSLRIFLAEFILIVVAIFLGNLATDWNNKRLTEQETQEALELMCEELEQNYHNLTYYRKYYPRSLDLLDSLTKIGKFDEMFSSEGFHGINPPAVYTFAYEMAKSSSKFANIGHADAKVLYMNYVYLDDLRWTTEQAQQRLVSGEMERPDDWQVIFNFYREPIELFYKNFAVLQERCICPPVDAEANTD